MGLYVLTRPLYSICIYIQGESETSLNLYINTTMDVDLILEAAVLMDKKANGNNNTGTDESQETSGNGPGTF